jgi:hypothetical protein
VNLRYPRDVANVFVLLTEKSDSPSCADRATAEAQPYVLRVLQCWEVDHVLASIVLISKHLTAVNNQLIDPKQCIPHIQASKLSQFPFQLPDNDHPSPSFPKPHPGSSPSPTNTLPLHTQSPNCLPSPHRQSPDRYPRRRRSHMTVPPRSPLAPFARYLSFLHPQSFQLFLLLFFGFGNRRAHPLMNGSVLGIVTALHTAAHTMFYHGSSEHDRINFGFKSSTSSAQLLFFHRFVVFELHAGEEGWLVVGLC